VFVKLVFENIQPIAKLAISRINYENTNWEKFYADELFLKYYEKQAFFRSTVYL